MSTDAADLTPPPSPSDRPSRPGAALPADALAHLGVQLRRAFEPDGDEGGLEPFADLLALLEARLAERRRHAADGLRDGLIAAIPALRAFALSLTYSADRADDLVQDTLMRAWAKADTFTPGTHLIAWLFTILRNLFYTEQRKKGREVEDADGRYAEGMIALPDHDIRLDLADLRTALTTLPAAQREALILVGAQGLSYEETAAICAVAVGTIKSRVNRARTTLVHRLGMAGTDDIGVDAPTRAAMDGAP